MINHFQAVGMLICDLRQGRNLQTKGIAEDIQDNFREILVRLGYAWYQKVELLEYILDFHIAEAERLRDFVGYEQGKDYPAIRLLLYEELSVLIKRLKVLMEGEPDMEWTDLM